MGQSKKPFPVRLAGFGSPIYPFAFLREGLMVCYQSLLFYLTKPTANLTNPWNSLGTHCRYFRPRRLQKRLLYDTSSPLGRPSPTRTNVAACRRFPPGNVRGACLLQRSVPWSAVPFQVQSRPIRKLPACAGSCLVLERKRSEVARFRSLRDPIYAIAYGDGPCADA